MSENPTVTPFRSVRALVAGIAGLGGHALVILAGFIAARVTPKTNDGFRDLANLLGVLLLGEVIVGLTCLVVGTVLFVKGRRDLGLGLIAGWVLGIIAMVLFVQTR